MNNFKKTLKQIRYFFESLAVRFGLFLFHILGLKNAANFGSFLSRSIGKKHSTNELSRKNMKLSMPDLTDTQIEKILDDMWDNLGRIVGEFVFVSKFSKEELMKHIVMSDESKKNIEDIKKNSHGGIIFSGHIGNWEIGPKSFLANGINVKTVYRPLNNEVVDQMTSQIRGVEMIAKSSKGNKQIIEQIKSGNYVIILADQKITDGIPVPFFGRDAITTTSFARLAIKYNIPLIPARSIRIGRDFKFEVKVEKPLEFERSDDVEKMTYDLTLKINQKLEEWIKEYPAQWFWVHNRWKK